MNTPEQQSALEQAIVASPETTTMGGGEQNNFLSNLRNLLKSTRRQVIGTLGTLAVFGSALGLTACGETPKPSSTEAKPAAVTESPAPVVIESIKPKDVPLSEYTTNARNIAVGVVKDAIDPSRACPKERFDRRNQARITVDFGSVGSEILKKIDTLDAQKTKGYKSEIKKLEEQRRSLLLIAEPRYEEECPKSK